MLVNCDFFRQKRRTMKILVGGLLVAVIAIGLVAAILVFLRPINDPETIVWELEITCVHTIKTSSEVSTALTTNPSLNTCPKCYRMLFNGDSNEEVLTMYGGRSIPSLPSV